MSSCLVDTNILLRSAQPSSTQHEMSLTFLENLRARGSRLVLVPQVIYEYWTVATRPINVNGLGMSQDTVETSLRMILSEFRLLRDERGVFDLWRTLVSQHEVSGKTTHDVRLVAAMQRHQIRSILTCRTFSGFQELKC